MAVFDYLDEDIVASALIQPHDNDSFYNPVINGHNGYAANGSLYINGTLISHASASWFTENAGPYRGDGSAFPTYGIVLLSKTSLVILDGGIPTLVPQNLALWMQFLLCDEFALTNNFDQALNGWTPNALTYADGRISITYFPDEGNQIIDSPPRIDGNLVLTIDFTRDLVYLDVAATSAFIDFCLQEDGFSTFVLEDNSGSILLET